MPKKCNWSKMIQATGRNFHPTSLVLSGSWHQTRMDWALCHSQGEMWRCRKLGFHLHPGRLTAGTWKWWFGRWFSFSIGWLLGSMLIFRGVRWIGSWGISTPPKTNMESLKIDGIPKGNFHRSNFKLFHFLVAVFVRFREGISRPTL